MKIGIRSYRVGAINGSTNESIFWLVFLLTVLLTLLLIPLSLWADEINIIPIEREVLSQGKGIITLRFEIENTTTQTEELTETISLPKDWQLVTTPAPFLLSSAVREVRLIHVITSRGIPSGVYPIRYQLTAKSNNNINGIETVNVRIKEQSGLSLTLLSSPSSLLEGESYDVEFLIKNTGNKSTTYKLSVDDSDGYVDSIKPKRLVLAAGRSESVRVHGKISDRIDQTGTHRFTLIAKGGGVISEETVRIPLIARVPRGLGKYHTLPGTVGFNYSGSKKTSSTDGDDDENNKQWQMEYQARGALDSKGKHNIKLRLRNGQSGEERNRLTRDAEYSASYWNKEWTIHSGHRGFYTSRLSGNAISGIGTEVIYTPLNNKKDKPLKVRAFYGQSRKEVALKESLTGASANYRFKQNYELGASVLEHKKDNEVTQTVIAASGSWSPEAFSLRGEVAKDDDASSYVVDFTTQWKKLGANATYLYADPKFDGSNKDIEQLYGGLSYQINNNSALRINSRKVRNNLDNDNKREIREDVEHQISINRSLWSDLAGNLSLSYRRRSEKDLRLAKTIDRRISSGVIGYKHTFDKVSTSISLEQGHRDDHLEQSATGSKQSISLNWSASRKLNFSSNYSISDSLDSDGKTNNYGINGSYQLNKQQRFSAMWNESNNDDADTKFNNMQLAYTHQFRNRHTLGFRASYTDNTADDNTHQKDASWQVQYSLPLDVPLRRRNNIGSLRGKVFYADTKKPAVNSVLLLDGQYAVTNDVGEFYYPNIFAKKYSIQLDMSRSAGASYILNKEGHNTRVHVDKNKTNYIELSLQPGAHLKGQILTFVHDTQSVLGKASGEKTRLKQDKGLGGILLQLKRVDDHSATKSLSYKRTSNGNGFFSFVGIPAGKWELTVLNDKKIPRHYKLEKKQFIVDLDAKNKKNIVIKAIPASQMIKKVGPSSGFDVSG